MCHLYRKLVKCYFENRKNFKAYQRLVAEVNYALKLKQIYIIG